MPDTDTIPVSASVASTGPGIRYIGDHAYANNNASATDTETTILEFTTGTGYIIGEFNFNKILGMATIYNTRYILMRRLSRGGFTITPPVVLGI